MADFIYVTIYNEGQIPWLTDTTGPVFGLHVGTGIYQFLARDPRINIKVTTPEEAKKEEALYLASKKKTEKPEVVKVEDDVDLEEQVLVAETVQAAERPEVLDEIADSEIDAILAAEEEEAPSYESVDAEIKDLLKQPKKYTEDELKVMTKKQLGDILVSRGYKNATKPFEKSSDFAPKYHDTVEMLVEKVLKTQ